MPKDSLEIIENDLLYSKKKVKLPAGEDKRDTHTANGEDANNRTDNNIDERIQKFQNQLKNTYWYRIPLKYIVDIGQVNTPIKFNTKWRITFETDHQKLFESKTDQGANDGLPANVDTKIVLESTPYLLYYQFELEDTFRTYLELAMISNQVLRTGIFLTPHQKSYEMVVSSKTFTFQNIFEQFAFLEFSLIFDRSDQYLNIFDSYNAEVAATQIKSIKLQNASNTYSRYNDIKFDLEDKEDRFTLCNSFVAFVTNGSSIVPESDYVYNDITKELSNRKKYFTDSDEKVYIDIRRSKGYTSELERVNQDDSDLSVTVNLKAAATKKMRLYIRGYYQTEYMYMLSKHGLTMQLKEYGVAKIKN